MTLLPRARQAAALNKAYPSPYQHALAVVDHPVLVRQFHEVNEVPVAHRDEAAALSTLLDLNASGPDPMIATDTHGTAVTTLSADANLAFCLVQSDTLGEIPLDSDGCKVKSPGLTNSHENTGKTHDSPEEYAMRPDGFEPSTYGLGNRRSIP